MSTKALSTFGPILTWPNSPWREHLHLGVRREHPAGAVLLNPGEPIDHLYFLASGEVLVSHSLTPDTLSGLFLMRENAMLGIMGFFAPTPGFARWLVVEPSVVYMFSRETVYNRVPNALLLDLLERSSIQSRSVSRRFVAHSGKAGEARLAQLILHLMESCPAETKTIRENSAVFPPGITQSMAGYMLGMHAVTLNRLLAALRKCGVMGGFTKNHLEIRDLAALNGFASGTLLLRDFRH